MGAPSGKQKRTAAEFVAEAAKPDARVAALEEENKRLSKLLGLVEAYHAAAGDPPDWLRPAKRPKSGRATAVMQLSDLHLDETVNPAEVGGLNAYDRRIAEMRLKRWATKACDMGDRYKHEWDGAIVCWGGDMVSGAIHDELRETNADVLPGTMVHWAPIIAAAICSVADFYGRVHVPCVVGNHGRLTHKMQAKRRARNSWDYLLSAMVRSHLADDKRITWDIADGSYLFVPVYDRLFWLSHGDEAKGGGGWAGVFSPLGTIHRRAVELAASHNKRIDFVAVGHWHSTLLAHSRGLVCNGSTKGYCEYASSLRLRPEPAQQNWFAMTPEHGATIAGALFLEDARAEGWK